MEIEIWLDVEEADPNDIPEIEKRFNEWYKAGAEARYGHPRYEYLAVLDKPFRYQVDLGLADFTNNSNVLVPYKPEDNIKDGLPLNMLDIDN